MRRLLTPLAALLLVPSLLVGCGSDDPQQADTLDETTTTSTATEPTAGSGPADTAAPSGPITQDALAGVLLTVNDMPSGWSVSPPDAEDADEFCKAAPDYREPTLESEVSFQESDFGPFVIESAGTYDDAKAFMTEIRKVVEACRDFTETDDDGTESKGSFQPLSFPKFGEETFATRLSGNSGGFPISGDIVFVRLDDELVLLCGSLGVVGGGVDGFEALVRKAVERAATLT